MKNISRVFIVLILLFVNVQMVVASDEIVHIRVFGQEGVGASYFSNPHGISSDLDGNIYIADTAKHGHSEVMLARRF